MRCADCGTTDSGVAYLEWNGVHICDRCWRRGSYGG